jgi:hypothetical protein
MSIASLGIVGSLAGTALPQRAAETEKLSRGTTEQSRANQAAEKAADAAGIGQTEEDSQTSERDADGRRLWEQPADDAQLPPKPTPGPDLKLPLAKDPSGACGKLLDLLG